MEAIRPLKHGAPEDRKFLGGLIRNRQGAGKATNQTATLNTSKDTPKVDTDILIEQVTSAADSIAAALHLANNETDRSILIAVLLWSVVDTVTNLDDEIESEAVLFDLYEQTGTLLALLSPVGDEDGGDQ